MKASDIAAEAANLVGGDRAAAYGDAIAGWSRVAELWSALLNHPVTPHDAANMMELLKIARRYSGPFRADNYVDGAGYAAVAGEIASRETRR